MNTIRCATVNALNLYGSTDPSEEERFGQLEQLVRALDPDVVAVQEIIAAGASTAEKRPVAEAGLRRLAEAVGLCCETDGRPAVAVGGIHHHPGLLWRDGLTPIPGTLHELNREMAGMWHGAVSVVLDLGGPRARVGSVQLSPFDQAWAQSDASQLLRVFNRGDFPGLLGGDFNGLASDPAYDVDCYATAVWHPDHVYQLGLDGAVDRQTAIRLERLGRLQDCARLAGAPWKPSSGHHPDCFHPPRRVDRWYATQDVPPEAIVGYAVAPVADVGTITDHLPIVITVDPAAMTGGVR